MSNNYPISGAATVLVGDAVVGFYNPGLARWEVQRANATNLSDTPTALGIVTAIGGGIATVYAAGEVVDDSYTQLGAGAACLVAVDPNAGALVPNLVRVERPNGTEFLVGACDADGHTSVQPRASRDTSPHHIYNVCAHGARGDGKAFHDGVIDALTLNELTSETAGFTADDIGKVIRVVGADALGATLVTLITGVVGNTATLMSPADDGFENLDGIVYSTDNSDPIANAVAAMPSTGGVLLFPSDGVYVVADDTTIPASVQVSFDEGAVLAPIDGKTLTIEGRIRCHGNQHVLTGIGDIEIGSNSFAQLNVKNWGARGDAVTNDLPAFRTVLRAMDNLLPGDTGGELFIPSGVYVMNGTLGDENARIPINTTLRGASAGGEFNTSDPGTVLEFRDANADGVVGFYDAEAHVAAGVVIRDLCIKDGHVAPPRGPIWTANTRVPLGQAVLPTEYNGFFYVAGGPLWSVRPTPLVPGLPEVGDRVLPTVPNGCYYECTRAPDPAIVLGPIEPAWTDVNNDTFDDPPTEPVDGAQWTCRTGLYGYTGETDAAEPAPWPTTEDARVHDGSITWTAHALQPRREGQWGFNPDLGDVVIPTTPNGHYYVCIVAGNVGGAEPGAWPTTPGAIVPGDGDVTWMEAGRTLDPVWRAGWDPPEGQTVIPESANGFYYTRTNAAGGAPTTASEPIWPTPTTLEPNPWIMDGDVKWTLTGPTRAGLRFHYGSHLRVERVRFAGWQFSTQLQGCSDVDISHSRTSTDGEDWAKGTQFPNNGSIGVLVGVGKDETVQSTQTISIHHNLFGGPETSVTSNGGSNLHVHSNTGQLADCGQFAKIHGSSVSIWENNVTADRPPAARGVFRLTGTPFNVTIRNNSIIAVDRPGVVIEDGCNGFTLVDNEFVCGSPDVRGILLTTGPNTLLGNTFTLPPFFDADTCAGAMITMSTPDGENSTKLGIHTCKPRASLDLLHGSGTPEAGGTPAIIMRNAQDEFFEHSILNETPPYKQRIRYRVPNDGLGKDGGALTIIEMKALEADETDDICAIELPPNCVALATWTLVGRDANGTTTWKRSQMVQCAGGAITLEPANTAPPAPPPMAGPTDEVGPFTIGSALREEDGTYYQGFLYDDGATIAVKIMSWPMVESDWQCELHVVILQE